MCIEGLVCLSMTIRIGLIRVDGIIYVKVELDRNIGVDFHAFIVYFRLCDIQLELLRGTGIWVILLRKTLLCFVNHVLHVILLFRGILTRQHHLLLSRKRLFIWLL